MMPIAKTLSWPAAMLLLSACGSESSRHVATITNACAETGDPAVCACVADSLATILDTDGLAAMAGFIESLAAAEGDEAQGVIAMSAFQNPVLLKGLQEGERLDPLCRQLALVETESEGRRDGGASGRSLSGTYLPQLGDVPVSERRLAAATADRRWEFSDDGTVTTYSQAGARRWTWEVRGKEIRLTGAGAETRGERRRLTFHSDGRCIWDGSGTSSVDMRFCPE